MANVITGNELTIEKKIALMREDARYEALDHKDSNECFLPDHIGLNNIRSGCSAQKIPKLYISNNCIFNCAYCSCRSGNDRSGRYSNEPRELAKIAVDQAHKNGHGVFISSAIYKDPDYTEELMIETLKIMRSDLDYQGFIHAKIMPGTDPLLIKKAGLYANRLSVNIEVAKSEGYSKIAKQKNKDSILTPMQQISDLIKASKADRDRTKPRFATSQTTQLMAGSTDEDDRTIMVLIKALYRKFGLKRVYYTPFQYQHRAAGYDLPYRSTPAWRIGRLYQADRLLQLYGFTPDEVTPESYPNLTDNIDPKLQWALRNMHLFPIEVNTADFDTLIRIPGIGITYARKIICTRKYCSINHDILRKIGIPLRKSVNFMTCQGKYLGGRHFSDIPMSQLSVFDGLAGNTRGGAFLD